MRREGSSLVRRVKPDEKIKVNPDEQMGQS